jgi:ppGpp synthetase/RelA/SpoT-type nucleotidyltranferase
MERLSKTQVDKLGDRLRHSPVPSPHDLEALQHLRSACRQTLTQVARRVAIELQVELTTRLKTTTSIVEKMRRERTRLSQMQDIAGLRIVGDFDRSRQDDMATRLSAMYPASQVIDRRARPSHGYRAVHVIVMEGDCRVEIQIRTRRQDDWARMVERLPIHRSTAEGSDTDSHRCSRIGRSYPGSLSGRS